MKNIDYDSIKFLDFVYPFLSNNENDISKVIEYLENMPVNIYGTNSLYIHIPFCKTICSFCPFLKTIYDSELVDKYLDCLEKEIAIIKKFHFNNDMMLDTIAIGGGTPTTLNINQLSRLFNMIKNNFNISESCEWSVECEAKSFTEEKASIMSSYGVNRVSIGVQTLDKQYRDLLALTATTTEIKNSIEIAKKYFPLQNLDFIYGFPGQTEAEILNDVKELIKLGSTSIEVYPLEYISCSDSFLRTLSKRNYPEPPSLGDLITLTKSLFNYLVNEGWTQSITYTFFSPSSKIESRLFKYGEAMYGKESDNIIGLGASSLSFFNGLCYVNSLNIKDYISKVESGELPITKARKYFAYERELISFPKRMKIEKTYIDRLSLIYPKVKSIFDEWINNGYLYYSENYFYLKEEYRFNYIPMIYQLLPDNERNYITKNMINSSKSDESRGVFFVDLITT